MKIINPQPLQKLEEEKARIAHTDIHALPESIISKNPDIILKLNSIFPLDLFPDTLLVDFDSVTVIKRSFPSNVDIETIPVESISDVSVHVSTLYATLHIIAANFKNPITLTISKLNVREALTAHRLIECLMSIRKQQLMYTNKNLVPQLPN